MKWAKLTSAISLTQPLALQRQRDSPQDSQGFLSMYAKNTVINDRALTWHSSLSIIWPLPPYM